MCAAAEVFRRLAGRWTDTTMEEIDAFICCDVLDQGPAWRPRPAPPRYFLPKSADHRRRGAGCG